MLHDIRFAFRTIAGHGWFSLAVVTTLALGIGLNTMVFTLVNAALFKPVPVPGGERLVAIRNTNAAEGQNGMQVSYPDFREFRAQMSSLEHLEAALREDAVISEKGNPPSAYNTNLITAGMFDMLHIQPILGRGFARDDEKPGAPAVALLGYSVWKDRYGGAADVIGRVVRINSKPTTIIGVMPEGFRFPNNQELWMPLVPTAALENRSNRRLELVGLRQPGVTIEQARTDFEQIAHRLATAHPKENKDVGVRVETFHDRYNGGPIKNVFVMMLAAVGLVLLIACSNVANMMLSRAMSRQREISVRIALGASRWQVIRQLLIESLILSVTGGAVGFGLALAGVHAFNLASQDVGKPYWVQFTLDHRVFLYFAALCIFSGLLFGLLPAWRSSRADVYDSLKDGTRSAGTQRGGRLASVLVVSQCALTLVLLTGAGMFVRSFLEGLAVNPGLPADQILTAGIRLPNDRYPDPEARQRFFEQLLPQVAAVPGVAKVAIVSAPPGIWADSRHVELEDSPLHEPMRGPTASVVVQSPGYLETIGLPLLSGRDFNATDGDTGRETVMVTEDFVRRHWPDRTPIGKRFRFHSDGKPGPWLSVIGVAANVVHRTDQAIPDPVLFVPYRQERGAWMGLIARIPQNPTGATSALREVVRSLDQDLPLFDVRTLAAAVERNRWYLRVFGMIFGVFAFISLVIASVGLYAVIAHATSRRTREIGVRMALGASSRRILGLVLRRGMKQLTAGLALGLAAAVPAARLMATLPFHSSSSDTILLAAVSVVLAAAGLFACWLPARRAASLNPISAIRHE